MNAGYRYLPESLIANGPINTDIPKSQEEGCYHYKKNIPKNLNLKGIPDPIPHANNADT
jgi:hypothetical protein